MGQICEQISTRNDYSPMTPTFSFCSDFDFCCVTSVPGEQGSEQGSEQGNGGMGRWRFCWDFIYTKIHRLRLKDCRDGGLENGVRVLASVHVMFYALIVFAFLMDRLRRPSW